MPGLTTNDTLLIAANQLIQAVNDLALKVEAIDIGGGCCCGGAGNGTVETPTVIDDLTPCTPPVGFADWDTYKTYKCQAANMVVDHLMVTIDDLSRYYQWFTANHGAGGGPYLNSLETYNRIARFLPELLPNSIEYNLTPAQLAAITQEMNDRYTNFHRTNINNNWATFGTEVTDFFDMYNQVYSRLDTDKDTLKQSIYDSILASDVSTILNDHLTADFNYVRTNFSYAWVDEAEATVKALLVNGLMNIPFFQSSFGLAHTSTYQCTGDAGCICTDFNIITGTETGGTIYSQDVGGTQTIRLEKCPSSTFDIVDVQFVSGNNISWLLTYVDQTQASGDENLPIACSTDIEITTIGLAICF